MAVTVQEFNDLVELVAELAEKVEALEAAENERVALAGGRYEKVSNDG